MKLITSPIMLAAGAIAQLELFAINGVVSLKMETRKPVGARRFDADSSKRLHLKRLSDDAVLQKESHPIQKHLGGCFEDCIGPG
jgi:hypothetical protein